MHISNTNSNSSDHPAKILVKLPYQMRDILLSLRVKLKGQRTKKNSNVVWIIWVFNSASYWDEFLTSCPWIYEWLYTVKLKKSVSSEIWKQLCQVITTSQTWSSKSNQQTPHKQLTQALIHYTLYGHLINHNNVLLT